jgi:hypothetical protein
MISYSKEKEPHLMKKLVYTLIAVAFISTAAVAAEEAKPKTNLKDKAAITQLSAIQARRSMLTLCGVTGDELEKDLAKDKDKETKLVASLTDGGKQALPDALTKIDNGVKTSWDNTPENLRTKSCDALKAKMAAGK